MQKDLKIGLVLGLALVSVAGLWLATRPGLAPHAGPLEPVGPDGQTKDEGRVTTDEQDRPHRPSSLVLRPSSIPPVRRIVAEEPADRNTPTANVESERPAPQRFHIVRKDETLSEISYAYYGSAAKWRKIFEANRATVQNADVVKAGTRLIIPDN